MPLVAGYLRDGFHHAGLPSILFGLIGGMALSLCQIALLPYIIMELQQPVQANGWVLGIFSTCQLIGAPLFGRIGDALGPRSSFIIAMSSCCVMYIMMAVASSLPAMFLSQLPGLMIHGTQAAMMVVALETGEMSRTAHLAYLNLSYCVGLVAGGGVGASLANSVGPRGTLIVASAIQLVGCFVAFGLDEFNELFNAPHSLPDLSISSVKLEALRFASIAYRCASNCVIMCVGLFPILMARYAFTPVVVHIYRLTVRFQRTERQRTNTLALPAFSEQHPCYSHWSCHDWYICCTSQMTKLVQRQELGSVIGLNACLFFLDASLSQLTGLPLYASYGLWGFWLICFIITALLSIYLLFIDVHTFKAFTTEEPMFIPLQSVYQ